MHGLGPPGSLSREPRAFITRLYAEVERKQRHKRCIIPHRDRMAPTAIQLVQDSLGDPTGGARAFVIVCVCAQASSASPFAASEM